MDTNNRLHVLIADNNTFVREGLRAVLAYQRDMCVIAEAANGEEAIDLYRQHHPDVVLMDLRMSPVDGLDATKTICAESPAAAIVLYTIFADETEINDALQAGAKGWINKDAPRDELLGAIRKAAGAAAA